MTPRSAARPPSIPEPASTTRGEERQRQILDAVRAHPGQQLYQLQKTLGISMISAFHHVRILERAGELRSIYIHRQRHLFPPRGDTKVQEAVAALHFGKTAPIAERILKRPGITQTPMRLELGMTRTDFRKMMNLMVEKGLVRETKDSIFRRYQPTPLLRRAWTQMRR